MSEKTLAEMNEEDIDSAGKPVTAEEMDKIKALTEELKKKHTYGG
jgi:hypothetical protein